MFLPKNRIRTALIIVFIGLFNVPNLYAQKKVFCDYQGGRNVKSPVNRLQ